MKLTQPELAAKAGVGLRFIRELEQGKDTLRLDKVNQVLQLFGYETGPVKMNNSTIDYYLLQRIEHYNGLVILASNFKSNIDDAFLRRFQSIIHFPTPKASERLAIWEKKLMPESLQMNGINLDALAQKYELTGAGILNVVQYVSLCSLERGDAHLSDADIREDVARELYKEGKSVS